MNQTLIAHVTAEVVIVGGITFYFMRKFKQAEEQVRQMETQLKELQTKVQSADKHIQTLYQMIEGLAEQASPPRAPPSKFAKSMASDSLRNRKHKMKVVPLPEEPIEEDEEILELQPQPMRDSPSMPFSILPNISNMGGIFEMFVPSGPSPLDILAKAPSNESQVVVEDVDDDKDIQDELKELGVETN